MTSTAQRQQIDQNYDAFQRALGSILPQHRDEYALLRDRAIVDFFPSAGEAYRAGLSRFGDTLFSIQEVTDEPIDLGLFRTFVEYEWRRNGRRILIDLQILKPAPATDLTAIPVTALLDTGASSCGVSRAVAAQLNLPSIGKQPIITAGGIVLSERHLFRIGLPQPQSFPFIFDDITGFELTDDAPFQAVLGMDVLTRCDLELHRGGRCILRAG